MIQVIEDSNPPSYQCQQCGFVYEDKEWAEKCESWCREHKSCNLEIIEHGKPPEKS